MDRRRFPNLDKEGFSVKSPDTPLYNCIAWAAGETDIFWWTIDDPYVHWPAGVPMEETISAFQMAYGTLGYVACNNSDPEPGYEKVALYALNGRPKHAARQLENGKWTSKLGEWIDIEHNTLKALEGPHYGYVCSALKRTMMRSTKSGHRVKALRCHNEVNDDSSNE